MRHSLKKRHPGVAVRYLLMVLVSFLFLFPFYWMMRTSVMRRVSAGAVTTLSVPKYFFAY